MDRRDMESEADFVLDSRSLIVGFLLLMVVCGAFFVIGFMEGKRQGLQARIDTVPASPVAAGSTLPPAQETRDAASEKAAREADERAVTEQLDWYRSMNRREEAAATEKQTAPAAKPTPAPPPGKAGSTAKAAREDTRVTASEPTPKAAAPKTEGTTYSVQVGAFRQRREAEVAAETLKAKGYTSFIESPGPGSEFHLLKVGRFDSREEAVAMQLRLKKDGINSFVKPN